LNEEQKKKSPVDKMKVKGSKKMKDLEPDDSGAKGGKGTKGGSLPPPQ
jgi:hypothetical protein